MDITLDQAAIARSKRKWRLLWIVLSILVGVVAGVAPAWRGARLDPIEALRYE